jgi:hypothetical protein
MKQDKNNEMDLLLQSLARRGRSSLVPGMSTREGGDFSDHLDADELSSFAEGVVPAPARSRYILHLVDCESCRGAVINLTQASGAAARSETLGQQTGAGFWHKMASLFSPPVLRYAVPALALTAVIAISLLALRQQRRPNLIAQNEQINSVPTTLADRQQTESPVAEPSIEAPAKTRSGAESLPVIDSTRDRKVSQDDRSSVAQAPATKTDADAPLKSSLRDSPQSNQSYVAGASRPLYAPEPQAAPSAPKPALSEDRADAKAGAIKKEEVARREIQRLPQEEEKNQPRNEAGRDGPSRSDTVVTGSRRAQGLMTERGEAKAKSRRGSDEGRKDSDDEVETRTISGKRFRRQGNAWIDTAYDSSRGTTNVSRGSERFRALIADEPGIRTIAEKLNGLIIVVWNGRAYRIQ